MKKLMPQQVLVLLITKLEMLINLQVLVQKTKLNSPKVLTKMMRKKREHMRMKRWMKISILKKY